MLASRPARAWHLPRFVVAHLAQSQHRTAYYLTLNNLMGAATGFLFWLLLARLGGLSAAALGIGYAVVALGTGVAVVAKGGLDTAILQLVPEAARAPGGDLLQFGVLVGAAAALVLVAALAFGSGLGGFLPDLNAIGWALVAATAVLLVITWLQDAYFVALGLAKLSFERNLVLSVGRLLLPIPVIALALGHPIALTWALALGASALVATARARRVKARAGREADRGRFLRNAMRNLSGSAAEFLPGLLLTPLVLATQGAESAAYFGIAWTAAQLVFQSSAAIGRSALAQMIQAGPRSHAAAIRKGLAEHLWIAVPLALAGAFLAPQFLAIFGRDFAVQGSAALSILCASIVFVAPISLYLSVLRTRRRSAALVVFPLAMIASLAVWAPTLGARYGLTGVALAWLFANAPFGLYAAWGLRRETREVTPRASAAPVAGRADLE